ncbi:MAG: S41 family peptidase [bacterium]
MFLFLQNQNQKPKNKGVKFLAFFLVIILIVSSFTLGILVGQRQIFLGSSFRTVNSGLLSSKANEKIDFSLFWQVWNFVKDNYVNQPVEDKKLFYGALSGIVASLEDQHSVFLEPETAQKFSQELNSDLEGIGAEVGIKKDLLTIVAPLPDSPAEKAGLRAGDKILKIDDLETQGLDLDYAINLIRGKTGTQVRLTIGREGWTEPKEFTITRKKIHFKTVKWEKKDNNIILLTISNFNEDTEAEFNLAAKEILAQSPRGLILDLRNDPGGYLDTAVHVASFWVEKGQVVVKEKFSNGLVTEHKSNGPAYFKDYKTIVLVNQGSASGSEILAGALQDYGLATLVGKKTFGKGSVQTLEELKDGSAVKLTIAKWLTPRDRSIEEEGVKPDTEIDLTEDDYNNDKDPQLDKAIELINKK